MVTLQDIPLEWQESILPERIKIIPQYYATTINFGKFPSVTLHIFFLCSLNQMVAKAL